MEAEGIPYFLNLSGKNNGIIVGATGNFNIVEYIHI
jgi:hypothetical protein